MFKYVFGNQIITFIEMDEFEENPIDDHHAEQRKDVRDDFKNYVDLESGGTD